MNFWMRCLIALAVSLVLLVVGATYEPSEEQAAADHKAETIAAAKKEAKQREFETWLAAK